MDNKASVESGHLDTGAQLDAYLAASERRLFRLAVLATGNREEALDIVQEAMLKLVRNYSERPAREWPPLMHRILQTTIRDWYRRHGLRRRVMHVFRGAEDEVAESVEDFPATPASEPGHRLDQDQVARRLDGALRRLPLRQQQVFLLRAWEGLSVAETARAMGCAEGSVKTHYFRALRSLREMLGDCMP